MIKEIMDRYYIYAKKTGHEPTNLYLGFETFMCLKREVSDMYGEMYMLKSNPGINGTYRKFNGMTIFVVNEKHHVEVGGNLR